MKIESLSLLQGNPKHKFNVFGSLFTPIHSMEFSFKTYILSLADSDAVFSLSTQVVMELHHYQNSKMFLSSCIFVSEDIQQKKNVAYIYKHDENIKKIFMIAITEKLKTICENFGKFIYADDGQLFVVFENYENLETCIEQILKNNFKTL